MLCPHARPRTEAASAPRPCLPCRPGTVMVPALWLTQLCMCVVQEASITAESCAGPTTGRRCVSTRGTKAKAHCPGLHGTEPSRGGRGNKSGHDVILSFLIWGLSRTRGLKGVCENLCNGTKKNSRLHPWPLNASVFREVPLQAKGRSRLLPAGCLTHRECPPPTWTPLDFRLLYQARYSTAALGYVADT